MSTSQVTGIWRGPYVAELPFGQTVAPGDTAVISKADLESGHWDKSQAKPENVSTGKAHS